MKNTKERTWPLGLFMVASLFSVLGLLLLQGGDLVEPPPAQPPQWAIVPPASPAAALSPGVVATDASPARTGATVGAMLTGRTLSRAGATLSGIKVVAKDGVATRSDTDGRFRFEGLSSGIHSLCAEAEGLVGVPSGAIVVRDGESIDGVDLVLDQPCYVSGRVLSGKPLAEARVSGRLCEVAALPDLPPGALGEAGALACVTDAEGCFRIGPFPPGRVELRVAHDSAIPFGRVYPSDAADLRITLPPAGGVHGIVLAPDGLRPAVLERVLLTTVGGPRGRTAVVAEVTPGVEDAAAGRFRLPLPVPHEVQVVAYTRDFGVASSAPFRAEPGTIHGPVEVRAAEGIPYAGRIRDAAGAGIAGAEVRVRQEGAGLEVAHGVSARDGAFSLRLAPGRFTVSVAREPYSPRHLQLQVTADEPVPAFDCELTRGAVLAGRVLVEPGANLPALEVRAVRAGDNCGAPCIAPVRDGAFHFEFLPAGDYQLAIGERGDRVEAVAAGDVVRLAAGDREVVDLAPAAHGLARLRGVVTCNGVVQPFVSVDLARGDRVFASATADRLGRFQFDALAPGTAILAVNHRRQGPRLATRRLELRAGPAQEEAVAVEHGAIDGRLVGTSGPRVDVRVDVVAPEGQVIATARSGQDGQFRLPMVQAGAWSLAVMGSGSGSRRLAVSVAAGQVTRLPDVEW